MECFSRNTSLSVTLLCCKPGENFPCGIQVLSNEERERHEGLCVQPRDARECGDVARGRGLLHHGAFRETRNLCFSFLWSRTSSIWYEFTGWKLRVAVIVTFTGNRTVKTWVTGYLERYKVIVVTWSCNLQFQKPALNAALAETAVPLISALNLYPSGRALSTLADHNRSFKCAM